MAIINVSIVLYDLVLVFNGTDLNKHAEIAFKDVEYFSNFRIKKARQEIDISIE